MSALDTPRWQIAQMADDWNAVNDWLNQHPTLTVTLPSVRAIGAVYIHDLDEATARELLLCGAPPDSVTLKTGNRLITVTRSFGSVDVMALISAAPIPETPPVVLNPAVPA